MSAATALRAQALALRAQADALDALASTLPDAPDGELLGVAECSKRFGVGRDAIKRAAERGELRVSRGPRQRILVRRADLEAWLVSRPLLANDAGDEWTPDAKGAA